jgi:hypothetical protein
MKEFDGKVVEVRLEEGISGPQYHIEIEPIGFVVKGPTGRLHEWVPISKKATEKSVPEGSVADKYIQQLEIVMGAAVRGDAITVDNVFMAMKGKRFRFLKMKHGKAFEGHDAKERATPIALLP